MSRRKKKKNTIAYSDVELNIMPFIDTFSVLITFLLMAAVFVVFGIIEVQIPFLSNAQPPEKPARSMSVTVTLEEEKVLVESRYNIAPINEKKEEFKTDEQGIGEMHQHLVDLRQKEPESDTVSFFIEDEVLWEKIAEVLDAIKLRGETDPVFPSTSKDPAKQKFEEQFVYPKVVFSSVLL